MALAAPKRNKMQTTLPRLGAHMSVAGGFEKAIERGLKVGCQTVQIFTKSNNQWAAAAITTEQAERFKTTAQNSGIHPIFAHDAYLINVGSPDSQMGQRSRAALKTELERATELGLSFLVMHPGSHMGAGEDEGVKRIGESVSWALEKTADSSVKILYEIAAGQGTAIGHRFEHLAALLRFTRPAQRVGVCLDTCHLFAAGYDIRNPTVYAKTMADFDRIVGLKQVQAIHLNDSKKELGARVDRHEHIGQGYIGLEGFRCLLNDPRLKGIPMVLETPKDEKTMAEDVSNLKTLRGLVKGE